MKLYFFALTILMSSISNAQVSADNRQLVLVVSEAWEKTPAHMYRFARLDNNEWKLSPLDPIPVVLGKNGMGWGSGLHSQNDVSLKTPRKIEGDGKAPAGTFRFGLAFGYEPLKDSVRLAPLRLSPTIECVDDQDSAYYNKIVDKKDVAEPDWKSSEVMRRKDELYRFGIVIEHNTAPIEKGKGSCIFVHIWNGPDSSTAGCTAMHEHHVRSLIDWMNPDLKPVLIQLPWSEYLRLKQKWNLPEITKKFGPYR